MRDLILLHGALETSQVLKPLGDLLAPHFKCHYLAFSGHDAKSAMPQDFRIETFLQDFDQFLKKQKLQQVTVFGHSMGGYVALAHKSQMEFSPLSRIVTYGTKFDWSEASVAKMLVQLHPDNEALMEHLKKVFGDNAHRLLASTTHMMSHLERLDGLTRFDLSDIDIPVELVWGEKEKVVTLEETNQAASFMSHAQVHILKDSRHEMERCQLKDLVNIIVGS